jgi:beta-N-acetylhexosaminidase
MSANRADVIGQFLLLELEDDRWSSSLERRLRILSPGGILLRAGSLRVVGATAELLAKIAGALPGPVILAFEEYSGTVDALQAFFPMSPSPRAAAGKGLQAVARMGELTGTVLKLLGFNTVLAPLLDVAPPGADDPRTFGSDPQVVAHCGKAYIDGFDHHKMLACAKFFPGLGSAEVDRHSGMPRVGRTMAELWRKDLVPYRALHDRLPLVMVGHGAYKAYDFAVSRPATLSSSVVQGLLRAKLGYRGVIVADDLASVTIRGSTDPQEAAAKSFVAGCDLLRISDSHGKTSAAILKGLKGSLEAGTIPAARVEEASARLQRVRRHLPPPRAGFPHRDFDRLTREVERFAREFRSKGEKGG